MNGPTAATRSLYAAVFAARTEEASEISSFTSRPYPWPQDKPGGTMEPLLLPWGGIPSMRYTRNGSQFAAP